MTDQDQSLLSTLSNELSENQFDAAQETISDLSALYDERQEEESRRADQSRALYLDTDTVSIAEATELDALGRVNGTTQFTRSMLLTVVSGIVELREDLAEQGQLQEAIEVAQAAIEELSEAESELEERASATQDILDSSTIPPTVRISITTVERQTIALGEGTLVKSNIRNSGDDTAEDVVINIESSDGIDVTPPEIRIGSLPDDTRIQKTIDVSGVDTGIQAIELRATSENAGQDLTTGTITVVENDQPGVGDYAENGQIKLAGLRDAIADWRVNKISNDLLAAITEAWRRKEQV